MAYLPNSISHRQVPNLIFRPISIKRLTTKAPATKCDYLLIFLYIFFDFTFLHELTPDNGGGGGGGGGRGGVGGRGGGV